MQHATLPESYLRELSYPSLKYGNCKASKKWALGLPDKLEGYYRPKKDDHLKSLQKYVQKIRIAKGEGVEIHDPYNLVYNVQYLQKKYRNGEYKRIEIDLVLKEVGNKRFWDFIIFKLKRLFSTRDYTRAINIPSYITPEPLGELNGLVLDIVERIVKPQVDVYKETLREHKTGFLQVAEYE
jgi:hypothetical protein